MHELCSVGKGFAKGLCNADFYMTGVKYARVKYARVKSLLTPVRESGEELLPLWMVRASDCLFLFKACGWTSVVVLVARCLWTI